MATLFTRYTEEELLQATGNAWKVALYRDGNRKRFSCFVFVRSKTRESAKLAAMRIHGGRSATAIAWDPLDPLERMGRFVTEGERNVLGSN